MGLEIVGQPPPSHNLFGQLGPRCPVCSGLGHVLRMPAEGGRPTRASARCICGGSGVDMDQVRAREHASLIARVAALEAALARRRPPSPKNSRQYWQELIAWATADGTVIANTTTEAIIFPNITIPANYMQDGRALRMRSFGKLSTTATPTMIWALRWGGVSGTLLATSEAITMGSGVTNVNWSLELMIQTRVNGATGTLIVMGDLAVHTAAGTVLSNVMGVSGFDAPAGVTVDLTADTALSLTGDWSAASASNTLTGLMHYLESLN